ncbi:hypothetical protein M9Y10_010230 [Tritrichomonas musculus]|uniref:Uncharacterized protein n=1 Tax=Tritrichomonas musculus TaxID=1915356 RepID=A0ABR2IQN8_9EUKA
MKNQPSQRLLLFLSQLIYQKSMRQITDNQLYVHHLYESDVFPYGEHSVSIRSKKPDNQLYEIYKLVFWPSLKARRLNSTWNTESDGIGCIRQYSVKEDSVKTGSFTKTFSTSKIWLYGSTFSWGDGGMEVSNDRHDYVS